MTEEQMIERVQALENRLADMVSRWNSFISGDDGVTRPRVAGIEKRLAGIESICRAWLVPEGVGPLTSGIARCFTEIKEALQETRQRIVDGEAKAEGAMRYRGTWPGVVEQGKFRRGDVCTSSGSLWCPAVDGPSGRPGDASGHWQMMIKSGA